MDEVGNQESPVILFFKFIYLLREREREKVSVRSEKVRGREGGRKRENPKLTPCYQHRALLRAPSHERSCEIRT